ncbi:MAG: protein translocase subunit SecF [Phycisphaerae bacterium]|nr:protein translocase subunit SecF [Gemmatimonadaceae bacterium]
MIRIFHDTNYDFIKWWKVAAIATAAFIGLGLASFAVNSSVNYSIEFTGGTLMQLRFNEPPSVAELRSTVEGAGVGNPEIQQYGTNLEYTVRARDARDVEAQAAGAEGVSKKIQTALDAKYGAGKYEVVRTEAVGPKVGSELRSGAIKAMIIASLVTLIYLAIRFDWRFGLAAVLATGHDILVTFAFIKLVHLEVSLTVVAAILTLLGYSSNDTIIIFDRVRENLRKQKRGESFREILNRSINETLPRSVLTHATVLASVLALLLVAGEVIRPFAWVMFFGIFIATFSSIYVAGPILMWIEQRFPRTGTSHADLAIRDKPSNPADLAKRPAMVGTKATR